MDCPPSDDQAIETPTHTTRQRSAPRKVRSRRLGRGGERRTIASGRAQGSASVAQLHETGKYPPLAASRPPTATAAPTGSTARSALDASDPARGGASSGAVRNAAELTATDSDEVPTRT